MSGNETTERPAFSNASVFVWLLSISAIWAHTSQPREVYQYWLHFDPIQSPAIIAAILSAFASALFPTRTYVFLTFCVLQLITIFLRIPNVPTHIVMEFLLSGSVICAYLVLAYRQKSFSVHFQDLFNAYAPVARWLLIIMYFFGTFHKINPGFLTLESSCAVPFIEAFGFLDYILPPGVAGSIAIYATLILEFAAMLLLLNRKTKYYGMLLGMPFHIVIGVSPFGVLAHFSVFAMTLHAAFLPSSFGERVKADSLVPTALRRPEAIRTITVLVVLLQIVFARFSLWSLMNLEFLVFAAVLFTLIAKYGKFTEADKDYRLVSNVIPANAFALLFLVQSVGPYIGLSTTGAVQMFSGLRTEGGVSNHYLIKNPPYLFPYLEEVVHFESTNDEFLDTIGSHGLGMNMYNYQEYLQRPETEARLPIYLRVNDEPVALTNEQEFLAFAQKYFKSYSYFERKLLHFKLIDGPNPTKCRH